MEKDINKMIEDGFKLANASIDDVVKVIEKGLNVKRSYSKLIREAT